MATTRRYQSSSLKDARDRAYDFSDFNRMFDFGVRYNKAYNRTRKIFYLQLVICVVFWYCVYKYNGDSFIPWFLKSPPPKMVLSTGSHALLFFPEAEGDGIKLSWAHAVNSKEKLKFTLSSDVHMIEADILLRGQGTAGQQLVPVMAHPPATDGDLTFTEWLNMTKHTGKGLKLDFKSIECVELCLQKLKEHHKEIKGPVWLNADVLPGPGYDGNSNIVDAKRFFRLCTSMFSDSTLSLGWKTGSEKESLKGKYTWTMVKNMHELVKQWNVKQPVTFAVRAPLVSHSVPQLKWLTNMTGGSLSLWMAHDDPITVSHMAYVRKKFNQKELFYDLKEDFIQEFSKIEEPESRISSELKQSDTLSFKSADWYVMNSGIDHRAYVTSESAVIQKTLLLSKTEYKSSPFQPVRIRGQAEFINSGVETGDHVGLQIYLRTSKLTSHSNVSGIKCFIGSDGSVTIASDNVPGINTFDKSLLKAKPGCIQFTITDSGNKITLYVEIYQNCLLANNDKLASESVSISLKDLKNENYYVAIKMSDSDVFVAIPQLVIES